MLNQLQQYQYIYLHGFASSPKSGKAQFFVQMFKQYNITLQVPDLNQPNFLNLTLTRQINQITQIIKQDPRPVILLGASMGGITSVILAEFTPQIIKNILFAPAFNLATLWEHDNHDKIQQWQQQQTLTIFHYGEKQPLPLHYNFYTDLFQYNNYIFKRQIPTLIYHGTEDNVVPLQYSSDYVLKNSHSELVILDDDHGLSKFLPTMWPHILEFIQA